MFFTPSDFHGIIRVSGVIRVLCFVCHFVTCHKFYSFCATLRRAKTWSPLRHGHNTASKTRFLCISAWFLPPPLPPAIMSEVQIVTLKKAALRFSLSDDVALVKEVVSKDLPFRFNSPSVRCSCLL